MRMLANWMRYQALHKQQPKLFDGGASVANDAYQTVHVSIVHGGRFNANGKSIKDNQTIADEFNIYFSNIGKKLANDIQDNNVTFDQFLNTPSETHLSFQPITNGIIEKSLTICNLNPVTVTMVSLPNFLNL